MWGLRGSTVGNGDRIGELDGVRGLAVLSVMFGHFPFDPTYAFIGSYGDCGVVVFFCLSGFLITRGLIALNEAEANPTARVITFLVRRSLRIFPIYFLAVALLTLGGYEPVVQQLRYLVTYTANYATGLGAASHLWSLSVEEQFYIVWPLVVIATPARALPYVVASVVSGAIAGKLYVLATTQQYFHLFRSLPACADLLGAGALLACLYRRIRFPDWCVWAAIVTFVAMTAFRGYTGIDPWYERALPFGVGYYWTIVLLAISVTERCMRGERWPLSPILRQPALRYVGRISYGLYLYHALVPILITYPLSRPAWVAAIWIVSFALAVLSWHCIEAPVLRNRERVVPKVLRYRTQYGHPREA